MSIKVALFYETDSCRKNIESVLQGKDYELHSFPLEEIDSESTPEYVLVEPEIIIVYADQISEGLKTSIKRLQHSLPEIPKVLLNDHKIEEDSKSDLRASGISVFADGDHWLNSLPARLSLMNSKTGKQPTFQHVNRRLFNTIKRNKLLFEASRDGLIIGVPSTGHIVEANQSFCDLVGYTKQEITGLKREDLVEHKLGVLEERREKQAFQGEITLKHKSGTLIPAEISSQIIEMDDGAELSLSIIRDIRKLRELRYLEAQKEKRERLLKDLSLIISQVHDFKESVRRCLIRISRFLDWPLAHAFFRKEFGKESPFVASEIWFSEDCDRYEAFIKETEATTFESEGCVSMVAGQKEPLWINTNDHKTFIRIESAQKCGIRHGLMLPVIVRGNTEAVIEFFNGQQVNREKDMRTVIGVISRQLAQLFERKITLDELKTEKEKFRLIAENSSDMISLHTVQGEYTYVSPSSESLIGYKPEELVGTDPYDIIYPADKESIADFHNKLIEGETDSRPIHYRVVKKNGEYQWVETTNRVIRQPPDGAVSEIQASTRDITFRKAYETELKEHINFNESVINSLPGVFFILSEEGIIERASNKLKETLGYEISDLIGKKYDQFIPEENHEQAESAIRQAFEEGSIQLEISLYSKSGEEIPHLLSGYATHQHGRPILLGMGINIADRVAVEEELDKEKKFIEKALNSLPGLFYMMDEDRSFVRINDHFSDLFGYNRELLKQTDPLSFYVKEDQEKVEEAIQKTFSEGEACIVARVKYENGEQPHYRLSGRLMKDQDRKFILGTGIDITDQVVAENELKQSLEEKETLLTEIHHRVKNNLALVSGMIQLQAYQSSSEEVQHYFRESEARIKSISIIHELLYQSHSFNKLSFNQTIKKLAEQIRLSVSAEDRVDLVFRMETLHINVNLAIPATLLLNELLTNIYKHAFNGLEEKGEIIISLRESDDGCIVLMVEDNGGGLPDNFSLDSSGTLGVTLIKILANQIGAELSFDSGEQGTTVKIKFERQVIKGSASNIV